MQHIALISVPIVHLRVTEQNWKWTCGADGESLLECRYHTHTYTEQRNVSEIHATKKAR